MFGINAKPKDSPRWSDDDNEFQSAMLEGVSRTFALTIPQLPQPLCRVVSNAYLLCRIVDTIEDEPALSAPEKRYFCGKFVNTVYGKFDAEQFAADLAPRLSPQTAPAEHVLIRNAPRVIRITSDFPQAERKALQRCIQIMARGMTEFQLRSGTSGLENLEELNRYCYYVAGVVGEMLTELFCLYSPETARNKESLMALAVPFGQGLQMTNILKDVWEDYGRGACWLPRKTFAKFGFDLKDLATGPSRQTFARGLQQLVGVAREHLSNALAYVLLISRRDTGVRNFCLWAIGFALLTLRKICKNLNFTDGEQVKISRLSVTGTILASRLSAQNDLLLRVLFYLAARPLPRADWNARRADVPSVKRSSGAR
jgi:farnesyl-diphosphate farnesyltransferase